MRIAIVVQRYGDEVGGGAELLCRTTAEHLVRRPEVEQLTVLTTCARDHQTWANHYPPGRSEVAGVTVERFPVWTERREWSQVKLSNLMLRHKSARLLEPLWFLAQGPLAPGLLKRIAELRGRYDVFLFYTYLYFSTVFGLPLVARKAVLAPTAHDEHWIQYLWFRMLFRLPQGFAFLTPEERDFVQQTFGVHHKPHGVLGIGVDEPPPDDGDEAMAIVPEEPYLLYVGRVEPSKGFPDAFEAFDAFKQRHGDRSFVTQTGRRYAGRDLKLALAGRVSWIDVPERDDVVGLGFVSEAEKSALMRHAQLLLLPSQFESLSIVILESWARGRPVLVDGRCAVTAGQVGRAQGGGTYSSTAEFAEQLAAMLSDPDELERMGESGRAYTRDNYGWTQVEDRVLRLLSQVASRSRT